MLIEMRSSEKRALRYRKKIRAFVLEGMKKRKAATVKREVEIERMVEGLVGPSLLRGHYMIFAKEINKLLKKHRGSNLITELAIIENKWMTRGLDVDTMTKIESLFGEYVLRLSEGRFGLSRLG